MPGITGPCVTLRVAEFGKLLEAPPVVSTTVAAPNREAPPPAAIVMLPPARHAVHVDGGAAVESTVAVLAGNVGQRPLSAVRAPLSAAHVPPKRRTIVAEDGTEFKRTRQVLCFTVTDSKISLTKLARAQGARSCVVCVCVCGGGGGGAWYHRVVCDATGWRIETSSTGAPTLRKTWTVSRCLHGVRHLKGSRKLTWEVISDSGLRYGRAG